MKVSKPRLFLDVDGVVLAHYGLPGQAPFFQMRPYVGSFITWASQHFDLYWLTAHGPDSTKKICHYNNVTQFDSLKDKSSAPSGIPGITYAHWRDYEKESENFQGLNLDKVQGIIDHGGLNGEWIVIEDNLPCFQGYDLINSQPDLKKKWIIVPDQGADIFLDIQVMMERYLLTGELLPPFVQPLVDEISLNQGLKIFTPEVLNDLKKTRS